MEKKTDLEKLVDFKTLGNVIEFETSYDKDIDSLMLQSMEEEPAVSVDWNGEIWVRVNSDTGKIVGIEIENFKRYFANRYKKYLGNRNPNNPYLKNVIVSLLQDKLVTPKTRREFYEDLERVCIRS